MSLTTPGVQNLHRVSWPLAFLSSKHRTQRIQPESWGVGSSQMTKRLLIGTAEGRHSPITYQLEVLWFVHTGDAKGSFGERDCIEVAGRRRLYSPSQGLTSRAWLRFNQDHRYWDYLLWFCSRPHSVSTWGKRKQIGRARIYCKILCPSREFQHLYFSFPVLTLEGYLVFHSRWDIFTNESSVHELKKSHTNTWD